MDSPRTDEPDGRTNGVGTRREPGVGMPAHRPSALPAPRGAEGGGRSGILDPGGRRQEQLLEINTLLVTPDPLLARTRILQCIAEELAGGLDEEGERHVTTLCTLLASAETQRLVARTERELTDMLDLYHRIRCELREAHDPRLAAGILARSVVPLLADVCLVDVGDGSAALRRAAVEASHLVPDARPIKSALATLPDDGRAPHDPQLVARTGITRLLSEVSDEDLVCASSTPEHLRALRSLNPTSYLCVPLEAEDSTVGAMTLLRVRPGNTFTGPHKRLAEALGEMYQDADAAEPRANPLPLQPSRGVDHLTRRELEVLRLINRGNSRESVAQGLNISIRTYDNHTSSIRVKLGVRNNLAALAAARAVGINLDD